MVKRYNLQANELREMIAPMGSCLASDRITVDGMPVGYMYREEPDNEIDSGWRFFAGDESREYADTPDNFALYDVNTIANCDPMIIPLLSTAAPAAFERRKGKAFVPVTPPEAE
jgi:hypothetical protein